MSRRWLQIPFIVLTVAFMALSAEAKHHARPTTAANLNPSGFVTAVTNKFFPLVPGTTFHYEGQKDGVPGTNDTTVLRTTKTILGVKCTTVQDVAHEEGKLVEKTFDWYAQDTAGNVWYFGEDSTAYLPDGTISKEGSWQAGVNGAQQGIIMEAAPKVGDKYQQENAPGVAQDMAQVMSLDKSLCVPYGCFDDLLLTRESTPLSKGDVEEKYYAPNVGFIYGQAIRGGNENTQLVSVTGN
jgi:hypothetical protein